MFDKKNRKCGQKLTDRQIDRYTEKQKMWTKTYRHTDIQIDRYTEKQKMWTKTCPIFF